MEESLVIFKRSIDHLDKSVNVIFKGFFSLSLHQETWAPWAFAHLTLVRHSSRHSKVFKKSYILTVFSYGYAYTVWLVTCRERSGPRIFQRRQGPIYEYFFSFLTFSLPRMALRNFSLHKSGAFLRVFLKPMHFYILHTVLFDLTWPSSHVQPLESAYRFSSYLPLYFGGEIIRIVFLY